MFLTTYLNFKENTFSLFSAPETNRNPFLFGMRIFDYERYKSLGGVGDSFSGLYISHTYPFQTSLSTQIVTRQGCIYNSIQICNEVHIVRGR